ncbi:MAG TPA: DUF2207 domain-containing protein [Thermoanaerobaculia bacterium]|nr:DUF2207 domain-containing protein [Thermoanaerobaculia bacterium]
MRRLAWVFTLLLCSPALFARTLSWPSVETTAHLDADGMLHVSERQTMLFDGDWNGGERVFTIRSGQTFALNGIKRIGDSGEEIPLRSGSLANVDEYSVDGGTVRWRSRLPSDPPFANQQLTYVLDYTYSYILTDVGTGNRYLFAHDFLASNRTGAIQRFALTLDFDPVWRHEPITFTREQIPPGETVVIRDDLTYSGSGSPRFVTKVVSDPAIFALIALLFAGTFAIVLLFIANQRRVGRLRRIDEPVTEEWLKRHVFSMQPEVAGAALHNDVGAPEVAALLARMTAEGKLNSTVVDGELHLTRHKNILHGREWALAEAIFIHGKNSTSTAEIRAHYADIGFSPAKPIKPSIDEDLDKIPGWKGGKRSASWLLNWLLLGAALAALFVVGQREEGEVGLAFIFGVGTLIIGSIVAASNARGISHIGLRIFGLLCALAPSLLVLALVIFTAQEMRVSLPLLVAVTFGMLMLTHFLFDLLKTPESSERVLLRKRLAHARDFFKEQLDADRPRLRDEWMPYLIALGLGQHVDRWFSAFGGKRDSRDDVYAAGAASSSFGSDSSSSSSGDSRAAFTAGGGRFGGGGATGTWVAAAAGLAAGVAAPSSSSSSGSDSGSSGGGGDSGSSSGGGSMGGW